ncbi:MAG: fasciclin domain-containing protein [Candidatus Latescibacteria bacterium]|nr:fasciclin domain-containing protein [Candidatus Latescibacterota bacterium]
MKQITLAALAALSLAAFGTPASAHCGSCGVTASTDHGHAKTHALKADAATPASILETAQAAGFSTLATAVEAAGLTDVLAGEGPFTVFAPTDEAFAKLPEGALDKLLADPEALREVLLYHVVPGKVTAAQVVKLKSAETASGKSLAISAKDGVTVAGAKVTATDVMASNGVIHVIDSVMLPN